MNESLEVEALEVVQREPSSPGDWRSAVQARNWRTVADRIDALPQREREQPETRYVRALSARQLGDCNGALVWLAGLAEQLPVLVTEIEAMDRVCRLTVGPLDAKLLALSRSVSLEGRLEVAESWQRASQLEWAQALVESVSSELERPGAKFRNARPLRARARELRAELALKRGLMSRARRDYRWLATVAVAAGADTMYEKLAEQPLSAADRMKRAEQLAERGSVAEVEREIELIARAPGKAPARVQLARALARANYRSRSNYLKAARLYEEVARMPGARTSDWFRAADAWARSQQLDRAVALYGEVLKRYPNTKAAERASYSRAQDFYSSADWARAVSAYDAYLDRYGQSQRARFVRRSRYERAIARLALGQSRPALEDFERLKRRRSSNGRKMLEHLEAVALALSGDAEQENGAARRFEQIATLYPLSFAGLASAARLSELGRQPPRPAPPPAGLPVSLPELPEKARVLASLGLLTAAERALHEAEPALRKLYSPRAGETLCHQYAALDRGFRRYSLASQVVERGALRHPPTPANLWAWQCLYPRPYASDVSRLERRHGLPASLMHAVMRQESAFRSDARSAAGAVGLMQLMPATAERAASELALEHDGQLLTQPQYNLELGAFYLSKLLACFDGRVPLALASYNAGPHAVTRWLAGAEGLPLDLWAARIPYAETRNYVARVMSNWARYRYLDGGPDRVPRLALNLPEGLELPPNSY